MITNKKSLRITKVREISVLLSIIYFILFNSLLLSQSSTATEGIQGNLVSVDWLEKNLKNSNVLIIDASSAQAYTKLHIPGAVNLDMFAYGGKEFPIPEVEQKFQSLGISKGKKIVIYDRDAPMMATRIFYDLCYYGFPVKNLFILNGGFFKWQESGKAVSSKLTKVEKRGTYKVAKLIENVRVRLPEFLTASGDPKNNVLLEALDANWHYGELQVFDRSGHIPFGVLLPRADFFNPDKTFKSAGEIKKMLDYLGINENQNILTYCGGGIAASVPFFALKFILGFQNVKLFSESELGWLQDERMLSFWTYDAPYLMRETDWLKTWGGRMMRMYGVSQVSIIDVRPAEAFNNVHIPFALNISSELFKSNINNPEKIAEALGLAGINYSQEVVVVSGEGLNEHSALAFLILEYLEQKKVSIFIDSNEKFAQGGTALIKEEKENLSKASSTYPLNITNKILITDPNKTTGLYPKVFISSGKTVSVKNPEGEVIHVPYTNLVNADGKPKAAKEIWKILQTAGVSRYAEIICFADNPGEAALNYFILKLMGYPDIKVLLI